MAYSSFRTASETGSPGGHHESRHLAEHAHEGRTLGRLRAGRARGAGRLGGAARLRLAIRARASFHRVLDVTGPHPDVDLLRWAHSPHHTGHRRDRPALADRK